MVLLLHSQPEQEPAAHTGPPVLQHRGRWPADDVVPEHVGGVDGDDDDPPEGDLPQAVHQGQVQRHLYCNLLLSTPNQLTVEKKLLSSRSTSRRVWRPTVGGSWNSRFDLVREVRRSEGGEVR